MSRFTKFSQISFNALALLAFCLPQDAKALGELTPAYVGPNISGVTNVVGASQPTPAYQPTNNSFTLINNGLAGNNPAIFQNPALYPTAPVAQQGPFLVPMNAGIPSLMTPAYGGGYGGAYGCTYTCGFNPQSGGGWNPMSNMNNGYWNPQSSACSGYVPGCSVCSGGGNGAGNGGIIYSGTNGINGNNGGIGINGGGNGIGGIGGIGAGIGSGLGNLVGGVAGLAGSVVNIGAGLVRGVVDIAGGVVGGLVNGISGIFNGLGNGLSGNSSLASGSGSNGTRFQSNFNRGTGQGAGGCSTCINADVGSRTVSVNGGISVNGGSCPTCFPQYGNCQGQIAI